MSKFDEALLNLDKAINLRPGYEPALRSRLMLLRKMSRDKEALVTLNNLISGVFKASNSGKIDMDEEVLTCMNELRDFMFEKVYLREETKEERIKAKSIIEKLVYTFETDPSLMPENYHNDQSNLENAIDYVAGMTDRYAIKKHSEL